MNIADFITKQAANHGERVAIRDTVNGSWLPFLAARHERVTTYATLENVSGAVVDQLGAAGLKAGDHVLVFHPMSAELYVVLLALFRMGAVALFLDPSQGAAHIEQCCQLQPPRALIASPKAHLLRLRSAALRAVPLKFVTTRRVSGTRALHISSLLQRSHLLPRSRTNFSNPKVVDAETPALITFTSGSTGQPKAAVRSHGFLSTQYRVLEKSLVLTSGETDLTTMPIVALANLASGITSLIPNVDLRHPGKIDPAEITRQLRQYRVASGVASPALWACVVEHCTQQGIEFPEMRKVFTGGAPVFPRLLRQMQQVMPNAEVVAVYGSTEAEPMAKLPFDDIRTFDRESMVGGSGLLAGTPVPDIALKIAKFDWGKPIDPLDEDAFAERICNPDEAGEIVVSGAHVLSGYLHGFGDEETKFRVDDTIWHRTGDMGYMDQDGRLWLLGRCAAVSADRHGLLYPFSVECALSEQPSIRRSAVVGDVGKRVLVIEPQQNLHRMDIAWIKQKLAWAKIDEFRIFKTIPVDKRHNAKIDYPALREMLMAE